MGNGVDPPAIRGHMTRKALDLALSASDGCLKCSRSKTRRSIISGGYRRDARLAIVTDAPSFQDDQHGVLLIGLHGRILDDVLAECGATREDVFTTSVLRCASPSKPQASEVEACSGYLLDTLTALASNDLRAVITLGQVATQAVYGSAMRELFWSEVRGGTFERCFSGAGRVVRITPTWHPRDVIGNRERLAEMVAHFRYVCASLER
jgi:DNA polymerase